MTAKQQSELDTAIERATARNIEVTGHGYRKSDHARIFTTTSHSDPLRWHVVVLVGNRLQCDCKSRVICSHRACVHMELVCAAARREATTAAVTEALELEALHQACRELDVTIDAAASVAPALSRSPKPRDDTRVFSLYR